MIYQTSNLTSIYLFADFQVWWGFCSFKPCNLRLFILLSQIVCNYCYLSLCAAVLCILDLAQRMIPRGTVAKTFLSFSYVT